MVGGGGIKEGKWNIKREEGSRKKREGRDAQLSGERENQAERMIARREISVLTGG